jgi:hypothetical protein
MDSFPKIESTGQGYHGLEDIPATLFCGMGQHACHLCFVYKMRTEAANHGVRDSMKGGFYAPAAPAILKVICFYWIYCHVVPFLCWLILIPRVKLFLTYDENIFSVTVFATYINLFFVI